MSKFIFISITQLLSQFGSSIFCFVIGTKLYLKNSNVTEFALLSVFQLLPGILILPFAGVLVDRIPRKSCVVLADIFQLLITLVLGMLFYLGQCNLWHVYAAFGLSSILSALHGLAFVSLSVSIVSKSELLRMNAILTAQKTLPRLAGPLIAGLLIDKLDTQWIAAIDCLSFLVAILAESTILEKVFVFQNQQNFFNELTLGFRYISRNSKLKLLLIFLTVTSFSVSLLGAYVTPIVLAISDPISLSRVSASGGMGLIIGSTIMAIFGGPSEKLTFWILFSNLLQGVSLVIGMINPSTTSFAITLFLFFLLESFNKSCNYMVWQKTVPSNIQGKVFSFNRLFVQSVAAITLLIAGPLAENILKPFTGYLTNHMSYLYNIFGRSECSGMVFSIFVLGLGYFTFVFFGSRFERKIQL